MSGPIDAVGQWSVDKLDLLSQYLNGYATVLRRYKNLKPIYIDAFASSGTHIHRESGEIIAGSPLRALEFGDVFDHFHFIDLDDEKTRFLRTTAGDRSNITVHCGDCNKVVVDEILPNYPYEAFYRVLAFVDPYGMHVSWDLFRALGSMPGAEMVLHFPIADINRNALHRGGANPNQAQQLRLTRLWGDESWKDLLYESSGQQSLFGGDDPFLTKATNESVVSAFRERLIKKAGFSHVPEATEVCGSGGNVIYYLMFAGHNETGAKIARDVLKAYRIRRR